MRIGIIGYGNVGKAFVKLLKIKNKYLETLDINPILNYVLDSKGGIYNPKGIDLDELIASENLKSSELYDKRINFDFLMSNKDIDVLIEMTPTNLKDISLAQKHIEVALLNDINVVTANKGPILSNYKNLKAVADERNLKLGIGCTVGGALPTLNAGLHDLAGSEINSIEAVLNGTSNFILDQIENKEIPFEAALKEAQRIGIAETDPTNDISGYDTATKLLILSNILMDLDLKLEDINIKGMENLDAKDVIAAKNNNMRYKLMGSCIKNGDKIEAEVGLKLVNSDDALCSINGKNKGAKYKTDTLGELVIIGGESGPIPAAASILRDIINMLT